jgi:hypothetical protein
MVANGTGIAIMWLLVTFIRGHRAR